MGSEGQRRMLRGDLCAGAVALLAIAGCAGANAPGGVTPGSGPTLVANTLPKPAAVSLTLKFPPGRARQYISPASNGLALTVYSAVATPPPSPTTVVDVSPTSAACVAASGGGRTCTFSFNAPAGNDVFNLTLYDAIAGGVIPTSANALSSASAFINVLANQTNVLSFSLGGIVKSVVVTPQSVALVPNGVPTSIPIAVVPRDADGFIIIDSAPFTNPISLAISGDSGNVLKLPSSATPITSSGGTLVNVAYSGAAVAAPIALTASATGAQSGTATFSSGTSAGLLPIGVPGFASSGFYAGNGSGSGLVRFAPNANASSAPELTLGESSVNGIAFDLAGRVVLAERSTGGSSVAKIVIYPPVPSAASTPVANVSSTSLCKPSGVAVDSYQNIYVVNDASCLPGTPAIAVFRQLTGSASGVTPAWTLTDPALTDPRQIAIDTNNNLYVAGGAGNAIAVYAPGARGTAAAARTISGALTGLTNPVGVTVDYAGNLVVFNAAKAPFVSVFAPNAAGNVAPLKTFSSTSFGASVSGQVASDAYGNVFVANFANVLAFGPNAAGTTAVPFAVYSTGLTSAAAIAAVPVASATPAPAPTTPPSLPPLF